MTARQCFSTSRVQAACSSAVPLRPAGACCANAPVETESDVRTITRRILRIVFLHFESRGDFPDRPPVRERPFGLQVPQAPQRITLPNAFRFAPNEPRPTEPRSRSFGTNKQLTLGHYFTKPPFSHLAVARLPRTPLDERLPVPPNLLAVCLCALVVFGCSV